MWVIFWSQYTFCSKKKEMMQTFAVFFNPDYIQADDFVNYVK